MRCSIDGCDRPRRKREWCQTHYTRWQRHGDPLTLKQAPRGEPLRWLMRTVAAPPPIDECIDWPYGVFSGELPYGQVHFEGRPWRAHRLALVMHTGRNPEDLHAAHAPVICHNSLCCNVRHLRWATATENNRDKIKDGTSR